MDPGAPPQAASTEGEATLTLDPPPNDEANTGVIEMVPEPAAGASDLVTGKEKVMPVDPATSSAPLSELIAAKVSSDASKPST